MDQVRFFRFLVDDFTSVRVIKMGETIPRLLKIVKGCSQCVSVTCCLAVIASECESKLKGQCK